ncbi:hypothetical protein [Janibacter cremeus]|uniref:Uncharacterized protein n=1 Tax=Janibacter cremeus TaxID=1285192 RepID=A0A852VU21_9MICO|nr:hypothetical protein [Janibacter cremeus]NYF97315.1 hypothetical protein [Janibacter cremeus]
MTRGSETDEDFEDRPERPPTRIRESSPIDAQRRPAGLTRALAVWKAGYLSGVLALVTAALWRDERHEELTAVLGPDVDKADGEQAIRLLIIATFAVLVVLLALTILVTTRLPHGGLPTRISLTVLALLQVIATPIVVPVLTAWQWEGWVTTVLFVLQAVLGAVGAVLMWLPGARWED